LVPVGGGKIQGKNIGVWIYWEYYILMYEME
jgi:hypothetical protein